jgi:hypothetical protein
MFSVSVKFKKFVDDRKFIHAFDAEVPKLALMLESEVKALTPVRTGRLKNSMTGERSGFLQGRVFTRVVYAVFVEFGTARMAPRAMMRRGADAFLPKGLEYLKKKLKP